MPKYGYRKCLNCETLIELKIKRDIARKQFCSRSCSSKFYMHIGVSGMNNKRHVEKSKKLISEKASLRVGEKNPHFKHGGTNTSLYSHWKSMRVRCRRDYAGKNRSVCEEWNDFNNFSTWAMSHGFHESLSLDRIDNSKGYYPENCQWIPMEINRVKDRKKNHHVTETA